MSTFKILSIDGGGSKGVYSLGVLKQVEALVNKPLANEFQLIYGTSTGSIIASLLALGKSVEEIRDSYFKYIPRIMQNLCRGGRSRELKKVAEEIFSNLKFDAFKTDIGIVTTNIDYAKPMIFKTSLSQAHGRKGTFEPGFGATIAEAVVASCAAFPYFSKYSVHTSNQGTPGLMDGGFVANNPTLFAITDAIKAYKIAQENIRVMSLGVGIYREPSHNILHEFLLNQWPYWLARKTLDCNTNTMEIIRNILLQNIACVRINEAFPEKDYETDLLETNLIKLEKLFQLGRESYGKQEKDIKQLLEVI